MKTNLDLFFKNNKELETDGIWFDLSDTTGFLLRRFGGFNETKIKAAMAKYYKPFAKQFETKTLSDEKQREISTRVFIEACMVNWKGIEMDGAKVEFSIDAAMKLLLGLPELTDSLIAYASDTKNYREDLGNS